MRKALAQMTRDRNSLYQQVERFGISLKIISPVHSLLIDGSKVLDDEL